MRFHDNMDAREAWTAFWQDPASGLQCIRGAPDIAQALRGHWQSFAASLPAGGRVLDMGCGAGAAASALLAARPDLTVTGIDFAKVPAAADPRFTLLPDTAMEALPFDDSAFDAAISQFGFEYSRTHKTARQMARVLAPAARFSLVVHHAGSSVVAGNRARLTALRAAHDPGMRTAFLAGSAFTLGAKLSSLQREHPRDALVQEIARVLPVRARAGRHERTATWTALETALSPERTILEAMDACCVAPEELDGWLGPLRQFCVVTSASVLRKPNGDPIAWRIDGAGRRAEGAREAADGNPRALHALP